MTSKRMSPLLRPGSEEKGLRYSRCVWSYRYLQRRDKLDLFLRLLFPQKIAAAGMRPANLFDQLQDSDPQLSSYSGIRYPPHTLLDRTGLQIDTTKSPCQS